MRICNFLAKNGVFVYYKGVKALKSGLGVHLNGGKSWNFKEFRKNLNCNW
jgi:hypothetical protein